MENGETTINTQLPQFLHGVIPPENETRNAPDADDGQRDRHTQAEHDDHTDDLIVREDEHALGALERVRLFVRNKKRLIGVATAMSLATLAPNAQAQEAGNGTTYYPDNPDGSLSGTPSEFPSKGPRMQPERGIDTYPYKDSEINKIDKHGYVIGGCQSHVASKLHEQGAQKERFEGLGIASDWPEGARKRGEIVNTTPAEGAAVYETSARPGGHVFHTSKIINGRVYFSDRNGAGGPDKFYSWSESLEDASDGTYTYIHFELPNTKLQSENTDVYENLQRIRARSITAKSAVLAGSFLASKDDRYRLVVNKGDVRLHDTAENDAVQWSTKTNKRAVHLQIKTGKGKNKNKNTLAFGDGKRDYKKWQIGNATKIIIGKDGNLEGHRGNKKVWSAESIAKMRTAAQKAMVKVSSSQKKASSKR